MAEVVEVLSRAIDPAELDVAVHASMASRQTSLTPGRRVVLEPMPDFDGESLTAAAPYAYELLRDPRGRLPGHLSL